MGVSGGGGVETEVCFHLNLGFIWMDVRHLTDVVLHFELEHFYKSVHCSDAITVMHTWSFSVSCTKNASPLSPSFICRSTGSPLISMSTWRSGNKTLILIWEVTTLSIATTQGGRPYHFLSGPEDSHLAEANVERRALQGSIGLPHHDDVDAAGQGGGIEASVQLFDLDEHLARQLAHVVHGLTGLVEGRD